MYYNPGPAEAAEKRMDEEEAKQDAIDSLAREYSDRLLSVGYFKFMSIGGKETQVDTEDWINYFLEDAATDQILENAACNEEDPAHVSTMIKIMSKSRFMFLQSCALKQLEYDSEE